MVWRLAVINREKFNLNSCKTFLIYSQTALAAEHSRPPSLILRPCRLRKSLAGEIITDTKPGDYPPQSTHYQHKLNRLKGCNAPRHIPLTWS